MADKNEQEKALVSWASQKFKDAMLAKAPYTERWMTYLNAWNNSLYENKNVPSYRSNQSSNFIFSTIESMRPIMFDANPKFEALPVTAQAMEYSKDVTQALDYEWYRTKMRQKTMANSVYTLVTGTSIFMLSYDFDDDTEGVDGNVKPIMVNPFNIYPDPLATCVEDAEYIIYATYIHQNILKRQFPEKAEDITGADIQYSELVNNRNEGSTINDQVLVLEVWCRDYTTIEEEDEEGNKILKSQFPLGRVITVAPDLNLLLKDEPNPYETGRFPFFLFKDIDVPFQFWGEGEVRWLLSPQESINDLSNQIIDNAKHTANQIWIIDKNAGIPHGQLTNRPGLVIRKNPNSTVERSNPPSMPMYVSEKISSLKQDIEVISGVHDVTRGQNPSGIESGAAIMALQEAAQTRIRLKIALHEESLADMGNEWFARMKQFWKFNRLIPKEGEKNEQGETTYDFIEISQDKQLSQNFRIKVVGCSTMNVNNNSMLDFMLRLAQTPAEDGMPMVTREAVLDFLPKVNKDRILQHFKAKQQEQMAMQQQQAIREEQISQIQGILGELAGGMKGINSDLGNIQGRLSKEDEAKAQEELKAQGYEMGIKEAMAMQDQTNSGVSDEMLASMAEMSDEELMQLLEENPELANVI